MSQKICQKQHYQRIVIFAFIVFLFVGTLDNLISTTRWYVVYFHSFVFTATCTFFCTLLICRFFEKIYQYPRLIFYVLFTLLTMLAIYLGVLGGNIILTQQLATPVNVLIFSSLMGIVFCAMITSYMFLKENLEQKISRLKEVELENERLKRYELAARLNSLQEKLNPHFLFNTLNSTAALIYENQAKAEENIVRLASLYRKIFSISTQNFIPLRDELELIGDMLELEKVRFDDRLSYRVDCAEILLDKKIPALLIEPLVENAIKHGYTGIDEKLHMDVTIEQQDDNLVICVKDNGAGFDIKKTDPGFGLYSIQERLHLLFGENTSLEITSIINKGTKVKIWLPSSAIK